MLLILYKNWNVFYRLIPYSAFDNKLSNLFYLERESVVMNNFFKTVKTLFSGVLLIMSNFILKISANKWDISKCLPTIIIYGYNFMNKKMTFYAFETYNSEWYVQPVGRVPLEISSNVTPTMYCATFNEVNCLKCNLKTYMAKLCSYFPHKLYVLINNLYIIIKKLLL